MSRRILGPIAYEDWFPHLRSTLLEMRAMKSTGNGSYSSNQGAGAEILVLQQRRHFPPGFFIDRKPARIRLQRDRVFAPQSMPQFLGDEGHERMQHAERGRKDSQKIAPVVRKSGVFRQTKLLDFQIPLAKVMSEEAAQL